MVWLGCMGARMIKPIIYVYMYIYIFFLRKDIFTNISSFEVILLGDYIRKSLEKKAVHSRD